MNNKTLALVSYITLVGWLVSFFSYKGQEKNSLVSYHLRQSFGLLVAAFAGYFVLYIVVIILAMISTSLAGIGGILLMVFALAVFVLMIMGILNANNEEEKPLPVIGKMFEGKFNFIP